MEDAHHLINTIRRYFKLSIDWEGQNYLGLTLDWNYNKKYVDISMPGYIPTALQKFQQNHQNAPKTPYIYGINLFTESTRNYLLRKSPQQNSTPQKKIVYNPSTATLILCPRSRPNHAPIPQ